MRVNVQNCYQRADKQWVVIYRTVPGARDQSQALSRFPVEIGRDCIVKDGRVAK